ncbi:MAG: TAXI family TRAP transporter solute-binding subunit [Cyanobacteria bacterium P01_D01_bin.123]
MQNKSALAIAAIGMTMTVVFAGLAISDRQRVYRLTVATGSPAGQYYAFGRALSEIVARHAPHIELTVRETEGSVDNVTLLETGKVDLAISQSDTPTQAEARAVAALFPEFFHVLATPEAAINRLADLRGKRIALMPERSGSYALFWQIGQHYGLTPQTVTALALPPERAHAALQAGEVDALSKTIALGNPATTDLLRTSNAQLVPIAQVKALQISLPFLEAISIPSGAYGGAPAIPPIDVPVVGVRAMLLSRADVNRSVIYELTRLLNERRNELIARYPLAAAIEFPTQANTASILPHPGATAYYAQDEPSFVVQYAEAIGLGLSVLVLVASALWQLRLRLERRQKNRADAYNLKVLDLLERVYDCHDLKELDAIRHQLFEILKKVVEDLDLDRIDPDSFASFTFPWEAAISAIRHRERLLMKH